MGKRIIIAISGASGAIYGIRMLEILRDVVDVQTHLIISDAAKITIAYETDYSLHDIQKLADKTYKYKDIGACLSSGSYKTLGMIIAPCSVKTMGELASGIGGNLITRSADVVLKEQRKLALMVRETPLHSIHLGNAKTLADMGVFICPPVPAFYTKPKTIDDIITHNVLRVLDLFDIDTGGLSRWSGIS